MEIPRNISRADSILMKIFYISVFKIIKHVINIQSCSSSETIQTVQNSNIFFFYYTVLIKTHIRMIGFLDK